MPHDYWMSLPVKNLEKSKKFFENIGFQLKENDVNGIKNLRLAIGDKDVYIILFENPIFEGFSRNKIANTSNSTEILFSIGVETKEELDEMYENAIANGGKSFSEPEELDGMYSCGFCDLDGHRWNILFMDPAIMNIEI